MEKEYYFEVVQRGRDFRGIEVKEGLKDLNVDGINEVLTSKIFYLYGNLNEKDGDIKSKIAVEILSDSVNEIVSVEPRGNEGAEVLVSFKEGVLDIEAVRVLEALRIMGINTIGKVKTVRRYTLKHDGGLSGDKCGFLAKKLLYNKVIEKAEINCG